MCIRDRRKLNNVSIAQFQLRHPAAFPPQAIRGVQILKDPLPPPLAMQQSVLAADGWMIDAHFQRTIATNPIAIAMQWNGPIRLIALMNDQLG